MSDNSHRFTNALESLENAREALQEAIDNVRAIQHNMPELDGRIDAYLLPALVMALSAEHEYLGSNSCNLDALAEEIMDLEGAELDEAEAEQARACNHLQPGHIVLVHHDSRVQTALITAVNDGVSYIVEADSSRHWAARQDFRKVFVGVLE